MNTRVKFYFKTKGIHTPDEQSEKEGYQYVYNWEGRAYCICYHTLVNEDCGHACPGYNPHSKHGWGRCIYRKRELIYTGFVKTKIGQRYFIVKENRDE